MVASTMANSRRNLATNLGNRNLFLYSNPNYKVKYSPVVRDRAKCWYCNGRLQNWERADDPWEEHANWFPLCEFFLQYKGPDYVHGIVIRFPNLRRPTIRNPANPNQLRNIQSGPILRNGHRSGGSEIIDPREEVRSLERKVDGNMSSSELVGQAKLMGFDERMIKTALKGEILLLIYVSAKKVVLFFNFYYIKFINNIENRSFYRKYETTGNGFSRLEILVESILAMEEEFASNRSEEEGSALATKKATPSTSFCNLSTASGLQEIHRLQEERM
ncbi:unnamed protein product [Clavelina lepadiformis]|uniref:Uncharacterized protein n=1 Tax=Clavelina lepadiformis TaxID=159417 RepID=A0ABP0GDI0_CLALP